MGLLPPCLSFVYNRSHFKEKAHKLPSRVSEAAGAAVLQEAERPIKLLRNSKGQLQSPTSAEMSFFYSVKVWS